MIKTYQTHYATASGKQGAEIWIFCFFLSHYSFILHFVSLYSDCETEKTNSISWLVEIRTRMFLIWKNPQKRLSGMTGHRCRCRTHPWSWHDNKYLHHSHPCIFFIFTSTILFISKILQPQTKTKKYQFPDNEIALCPVNPSYVLSNLPYSSVIFFKIVIVVT